MAVQSPPSAVTALLRAAAVVTRVLDRVVEPYGLSLAQYRALEIIRAAGSAGLASLAVRDGMIADGTTITRLLDKLEDGGLIVRERSLPDRRQVFCLVTARGRALLDELHPLVERIESEAVAGVDGEELRQLVALLDRIRQSNAERGAARSAARSAPRIPPRAPARPRKARPAAEEPFIIRRRPRPAP